MKDRYGCDMRGMLSFQILFLISKRPMHGDEIAEDIGGRRGEKPKPGTIYPALKELSRRKLIAGKKAGKKITYSITPAGRKVVRNATRYFCRCFSDVFESYKD